MLHFSVLGPLTVEREDGPAHLGSAMERSLLALLALRANEDVRREEVIDVLWGEHPPPSAWSLVHTHVARLRKWLEARRGDGPGTMLAADTGYRLVVDTPQLDLLRFYEAAERAELVHSQDPPASRAYYEEALRCWRGPVLSDLPPRLRDHPAAQAAAERRIALALVHAQLTCAEGRFGDAVAWLGPLSDEEPLHQSLAAHLMLALAGLGDHDRALQVYEALRLRLAEELDTEPGAEAQHARAYVRHRQRAASGGGGGATR
ncbi:winged helix-turn-helix domain-containing protein [Streptomyces sp. NA04227]|uniref:AfsR/SARP family transcriptional regulator n=1 Tax=Streptomyces sp. NA04227 TaxID=2742136 RepID=UPI00158FCDAC|nr:BTAD domain-containing putative transcriptional regulator [Streptomyces sp. NA04227]QKW07956.1 winged helix-turn-helix domain-containing protein [Streptomyces sp. NA04227]